MRKGPETLPVRAVDIVSTAWEMGYDFRTQALLQYQLGIGS